MSMLPSSGAELSRAAPAAGESIPGAVSSLGQTESLFTWGAYFQTLALIFLIVALLFAVLWFLKRKGGLRLLTNQGSLALESRILLGPKKSLVVVRFMDKRLLLGVTDHRITMLTELPADGHNAEPSGEYTPPDEDFSRHLAGEVRQGETRTG